MRFALVLLLLGACGKSQPSPTRPLDAAPAPPPPPPPPLADAAPPSDAAAAQPLDPDPTTEAEMKAQAEYMAGMLAADDGTAAAEGDVGKRRPGADLAAQIAAAQDAGAAAPARPRLSVDVSVVSADPEDRGDVVLAKLRSAYVPGLRRCFTAASFTGRPRLSLTVEPTGRTSSAKVADADGGVAACVEGLARNWRFPSADVPTEVELHLRVSAVE